MYSLTVYTGWKRVHSTYLKFINALFAVAQQSVFCLDLLARHHLLLSPLLPRQQRRLVVRRILHQHTAAISLVGLQAKCDGTMGNVI